MWLTPSGNLKTLIVKDTTEIKLILLNIIVAACVANYTSLY